ncbi:MAG: peptidylprolyl isomerase [Candidatus Delongbacteria bacterium]|nr:peptidylprolyl isomerase [Candidatus Delongbacteria bacterium]
MVFILVTAVILCADCGGCEKQKYYTDSAVFETDSGTIVFTFFEKEAPSHVDNFKKLVRSGYYDGKIFHRVIKDFVIQAGRDSSTAYSSIDPEIEKIHFRGALAAARMGDDINPARRSDGYEFYISLKPLPDLDGKYTVFGRTAEGFETVRRISEAQTDGTDRPVSEIYIKKAYLDTFFDKEKYEYYTKTSGAAPDEK